MTLYMLQSPSVFRLHGAQAGGRGPEVSCWLSQETLAVVEAAMMEDVSTADLTIKNEIFVFRVHKVILCSRLVFLILILLLFLGIQVCRVQSHDAG